MNSISTRFLLVGLTFLLFSTPVLADMDWTFPDEEVEYGVTQEITVECDGSDCPDSSDSQFSTSLILEICGIVEDSTSNFQPETYDFEVNLPNNPSCSPGQNHQMSIFIEDTELASGGSINIQPGTLSDETLFTSQDWRQFGDDNLNQWRIRPSSVSGGSPDSGQVEIYFNPRGPSIGGDRENYYAKLGVILSEDDSMEGKVNNLNDYIDAVNVGNSDVANVNIGGHAMNYDVSSCFNGGSRCFLGHDGSGTVDYQLEGEIVMGEGVDDTSNIQSNQGSNLGFTDIENREFHMCHEEFGSDYNFVYSPGDSFDADIFTCQNGKWEPVENGGDCEAGEAYYDEEDNMFYACYDDGSGNTVEEPYSEWGTSTQDWTESNSDTVIDYGPRTDLFPIEFDCDANDECSRADSHDEGDWRESWRDHGTMNYVEYVAWPSYLQHEQDTIGEPFDSKFVTDTRGWTSRTQALNDAEQLYGGSQDLDDASTWDGMNMTNTGNDAASTIYYGDDAEEYSEAWTVANAGSDEEPINPYSPNFQGGWAGECGEDQWRYMGDEDFAENDWMCDGATVEDDGGSSGGTTFDVVTIPGFENTAFLPDTEINNDEREIGLVLFPFLNMDSSERQSQLSTDLNSEVVDPYYTQISDADGEVEGVTVNCWAGRLDDRPETATGEFDHNSDRAFSGEASMPSGNQLWSVSDTVDASGGYSGYACEWWYDVTDFSEKVRGEEGDVAHVHRDGNLQEMIESEYSSFQEEGFP